MKSSSKIKFEEVDKIVDKIVNKKIVFIGEGGAGKTTMLKAICNKDYNFENDKTFVTIGADFRQIRHKNYNIQIWDTAGQERYATTSNVFYRGADCICLFIPCSELGANNIEDACKRLENALIITGEDTPVMLISSKIDLPSNLLTSSTNATNLQEKKDLNIKKVIFLSAKTSKTEKKEDMKESFLSALDEVFGKNKKIELNQGTKNCYSFHNGKGKVHHYLEGTEYNYNEKYSCCNITS